MHEHPWQVKGVTDPCGRPDFRWADLRDARFTFVLTHDPDYGRTDVTGARWEGARLEGAAFERVIGWVEE